MVASLMTDADLLQAALPWLKELLRRNMLGIVISVPGSPINPPKTAVDFPSASDCLEMDDHLLLSVAYSLDETTDDPPPSAANSPR